MIKQLSTSRTIYWMLQKAAIIFMMLGSYYANGQNSQKAMRTETGKNKNESMSDTRKKYHKEEEEKSQEMEREKYKGKSEYEMEEEERDGPAQILERDIMMMKDPALGYVPSERLLVAKKYKDQLMSLSLGPISGVSWKEQGPVNQGGRSRAVMVDPNDVTGNTVWAGSVGGGLWKTTNINSATPNWTPVNDLASNLAVTSIAYDPSNTQVMYFATGEGYNNSDAIRGLGVWKSTDGGATWAQLASTNGSTFNFCQKIVVNSTGIVLVATASGGLQRSSNGGTTWSKVLGTGLGITGALSNFCYDVDIAANGDIYATLDGSVHKSTNAGVTFAAAQTLGITASRIELACAPSDANYVYALVENGNVVNGILQTTNGGTTWTARTEPADADPGIPAADFSRGQAWYDLTIAVDPNNRDRLFAGGIDLFLSIDGAVTWTQVSHWYGGFGFQYTHADQHNIVFQNGSSSVAYFVNDGGVYRSTDANAATPTISDKGTNYRTAQFYACAIHPTAQTSYYLAGAQDNGTHQFKSSGLQSTVEVTGGDGAWCHIDQDQPQFQFTQYVYNDYYRSSDGGSTWTNVTLGGSGQFINPTDYDDVNNKMYAANNSNQYLRWDDPQTGGTFVVIFAASLNGQVSAVKVSPNTANRVFFGSATGRVVKVDNANTATPTITNISTGLPVGGYVSCVEVETGNDNHLLATFSNYGVNSVWESTNGGTSWTSVEGNLPDMPIRWALFNPNNNDQAIIATELGVWSTDNLNGGTTNWGATNSGLANVRVDMLQLRQSDKYVIAATHGRGLYASDLFTTPTAIFRSDIQLAYINSSIQFTNESYQSTSWSWNFGDGSPLSTAENPSHTYTTAGKFDVTLTINSGASTLTKTQYIQILPNRGTPYVVASDGGTFETNPDDFGSQAIRGGINKWERGVPSNFLTTVNSPTNVWKTDLDADLTAGDYACVLQTPSYNFTSSASAYTLRFRRSMEVVFCNGPFAVQLQYSTDKGLTWTRLGVNADPAATNWYNRGPATGCPVDAGVFADRYGWTITSNNTLCTYNITTGVPALVGQPDVTFRFVLSVAPGYSAGGYAVDGFMIDDFEILGPVNPPISNSSIITTGVLNPFVSCQGSVSTEQSFTVAGSGLTANLVVTPPTGFEVSLTSGGGFASSISLTPSSGSVPTTTIFVRLSASATGTPSGNIACTSTGATTQNVAVSGTVYNPALTVNAQTNVSCFGGTNGAASVNAATGGLAPYTYNWTPGNPAGDGTVSVTGLIAGTWNCTVTDANGCTSSITFNITQPAAVVANCSGTIVTCNGGSNGSASVAASGGTGTLTYLWSNSNTNSSISGLTAGTYTVTVADANGCTQTCAYTVTEPTAVVANCSGTNVTCNGGSNGSASVAAGGTGTLTYLWSNSNTNSSISGLTAGTYTVTVADANGCSQTCAYTVTEPTAVVANCSGTNVTCNGGSNGSASVAASGGTGTLTYLWSNSNTNSSISGLTAGTYTVTVADANGCTQTCAYTVTEPTAVVANCSGTNVSINGGSDGSASVAASGGTGTLTYLWNNSNSNASISALTAGTYTVTVTDANGCTQTCAYTVTQPGALSITCSGTNVSCNGASTGSAAVTVNTGNPNYTYLWSTNSTNVSISGLAAGTYTVTVTDATSATQLCQYTVTEPAAVVANCSGTNVTCNGGSNGSASVAASGGTGTLTYLWSNSNTNSSISGLTAGTYTVTVADANGCTQTCAYTVTEPTAVVANCSGTNVTCNGGSNGSASVAASGGTGTLTYLWSNSNTNSSISGLTAGTYTVTVADANGCTQTCAYTVTEPTAVVANCSGTNVSINGGSDGSASVAASGGTGTLTYLWNNSNSNASISALTAGTYTVTVTDANGCTQTCAYTVTQPGALSITCSGTNVSCNGASTGSAAVTVNTGNPNYTYLWSTNSTNVSISGLAAGTYTVTVTDATSATQLCQYTVTEPAAVVANCSGTNVTCNGGSNGSASVAASGGTGTLTYLWSNSNTNSSISGLSTGTYTVTVTDANGCTQTCAYTVTEPTAVVANCSGTNVTCNGGSNGSASVAASGGTGTLTYLWSNSNTNSSISGLTAGTYTVTVADANGCSQTCAYTVTEPTAVVANCSGTNVTCNGGSNGSASVAASGGTGTLTYLWSNSNTNSSISGLTAGTYSVTVTDANGCTQTCSQVLSSGTPPSCLIAGNNSICAGGTTQWCATAGMTAYLWNTGATTQCINVYSAGSYSVTVTDANGCTSNCNKSLTVNPNPTTVITGLSTFCSPGSVTLNAGAGFSSYNWSTGAVTQTISVNSAGTYTVTVSDGNGCTGIASKTITVSGSVPAQPGAISGPSAVCINSSASYSIAAVAGATSYSWSAGPGATVSLGQGTTNVTISFNGFATASSVSVTANNICGSGVARTQAYVVSTAIPVQPATLNGPLNGLCNLTNVAYNCPLVANATSYLWTVPAGVTILTGQGTNAITVKYTGTFTTSGTISVIAQSGCGNSAAQTRTVNAKPQQPVISGLNWACKGQAGLVYSVASVTGATSYTWTPVAGSTIVSGQGTTSIVYNWGGINGVIYCKSNNSCGSSLPASKPVSFTCKEDGSLFEISELNLYPNPASTSATLQFDGFADGKAQLSVYDLIGQQLLDKNLDVTTGNNQYVIDLSTLPKGMYNVQVIYNGLTRNTKLVVH